MPGQKNCPAAVAAHGLAQTNQINIEHLHRELYHLVAELRAMIAEVDRKTDARISEISADLDRLEGQLNE